MPTTRSATKQQTKLEEFAEPSKSEAEKPRSRVTKSTEVKNQGIKIQSPKKSIGKRGRHSDKPGPPSKKQKQHHSSSRDANDLEKPIIINRAPVLQLWGAVVAQFLHPELSWPACLSVGNAISALCAISKGRSIGKIEPKDGQESSQRKREKEKAKEGTKEISVMGFSLHLNGDAVVLGGKPKPSNEDTLKKKFGDEQYTAVKRAMSDSLNSWNDAKNELDEKAFHMYEEFRPNVAAGQRGWGRKGELDLDELASIVKRGED